MFADCVIDLHFGESGRKLDAVGVEQWPGSKRLVALGAGDRCEIFILRHDISLSASKGRPDVPRLVKTVHLAIAAITGVEPVQAP